MNELKHLITDDKTDVFTLGQWEVNRHLNQIISKEKSYTIEPKMMDVLTFLCQHCSETVSAEQLLIACWAGTFYGDAPVQKCIAGLRKKLGCNARNPIYIETIHRRGYKIIAEVCFTSEAQQSSTLTNVKQWTEGSPYLGLNTFDASHSAVYFGRTKAIAEVIQYLKQGIERSCHFLLLLGKSGSGKSSLIRAGVLPYLSSETGFSHIRVNQHHIVTPNPSIHESPITTLIYALNSLGLIKPELELPALILTIEHQPQLLKSALVTAENNQDIESTENSNNKTKGVKNYQLLVIDQFEQFLLDDNLNVQTKAKLVLCIQILAHCDNLLCIAMLRNDFYSQCLDVENFSELKNNGLQYDLQAASPLEITQMIRNPAIAAGLTFEHDAISGKQLDDTLLAAAIKNPDALPLLEYTLDQLYQQRNEDDVLLISAYDAMGGIEGAIAQQAEKVFNNLPQYVQRCWGKIMHALVRIDHDDKHTVTSRKIPLSLFTDPDEQTFIQRFLSAQLFVTILQTPMGEQRNYLHNMGESNKLATRENVQFITIAHEALLMNWQRVRLWIDENSAAIQKREQLADDCHYWLENHKNNDTLLNSRQKVNDGEALIKRDEITLNANEIEFVSRSKRYQNRKKHFISLVVLAVFGFSILTWLQSKQVGYERDVALSQSQRTKAISNFLTDMFFSHSPYVSGGEEMLVKDVLAKASEDLNNKDKNSLENQPYVDALLHKTLGTIYIDLGKIKLGEKHLLRAYNIYKNKELEQGGDYLGILFTLNRLYTLKGDYGSTLPIIKQTIALSTKLSGEDYKDTLGAMDDLGSFYLQQGYLVKAEQIYQKVYRKRKQLFGENFRHTLYSLENLGRLYHHKGQFKEAEKYLQLCLDKWLIQSSINNPYPLTCMRLLSVSKQALGKYQEAETLLNEHIRVGSSVFGSQHPEILSSNNSLAEIYQVTGRLAQSESLFNETLRSRRLVLGVDHIDTLKTQIAFAGLLRQNKKYKQALTLAQDALEKSRNSLGDKHTITLLAKEELSILNQVI